MSHITSYNPLKPHKQPLPLDQAPGPPLRQLRNSIHTSPEYTDRSQRQSYEKALEHLRMSQGDEVRVLIESCLAEGLVAAACADREVAA